MADTFFRVTQLQFLFWWASDLIYATDNVCLYQVEVRWSVVGTKCLALKITDMRCLTTGYFRRNTSLGNFVVVRTS